MLTVEVWRLYRWNTSCSAKCNWQAVVSTACLWIYNVERPQYKYKKRDLIDVSPCNVQLLTCTPLSPINVKSCLLILKMFIYFLDFFHPPLFVYCIYVCTSFFQPPCLLILQLLHPLWCCMGLSDNQMRVRFAIMILIRIGLRSLIFLWICRNECR